MRSMTVDRDLAAENCHAIADTFKTEAVRTRLVLEAYTVVDYLHFNRFQ